MTEGPLSGLRIIEFAGMGPGPFCAMLLADHGADIVRIERPGGEEAGPADILLRGRRRIILDLQSEEDRETCRTLIANANGLIEGFRPGVMERLGLGPDAAFAINPAIVYLRLTGWGQDGPLARAAGHDLNYIALAGALGAIGVAERPIAPLNLVGDYGGGALYGAFGMMAALHHAQASGKGQVVDCAMVDGAALMMAPFHSLRAKGNWRDARRGNILDGGAHFYDCYRCADGGFVSVAAIEPQFYDLMFEKLGLVDEASAERRNPERWPILRERMERVFATRTRDEWCAVFEGTDACVAPVLSLAEAPVHPHMAQRAVFCEIEGIVQPNPAPRFADTPGTARSVSGRINVESLGQAWLASPPKLLETDS